jgi:Meckel syndrome type 1 protein
MVACLLYPARQASGEEIALCDFRCGNRGCARLLEYLNRGTLETARSGPFERERLATEVGSVTVLGPASRLAFRRPLWSILLAGVVVAALPAGARAASSPSSAESGASAPTPFVVAPDPSYQDQDTSDGAKVPAEVGPWAEGESAGPPITSPTLIDQGSVIDSATGLPAPAPAPSMPGASNHVGTTPPAPGAPPPVQAAAPTNQVTDQPPISATPVKPGNGHDNRPSTPATGATTQAPTPDGATAQPAASPGAAADPPVSSPAPATNPPSSPAPAANPPAIPPAAGPAIESNSAASVPPTDLTPTTPAATLSSPPPADRPASWLPALPVVEHLSAPAPTQLLRAPSVSVLTVPAVKRSQVPAQSWRTRGVPQSGVEPLAPRPSLYPPSADDRDSRSRPATPAARRVTTRSEDPASTPWSWMAHGGPSASAGTSAGGSGAPALFAVLTGLLLFAAVRYSRLCIAPVACRWLALASPIERPG